MAIEIKEADIGQAEELSKLFSAHLDEQCAMSVPPMERNPYFNSRDFILAMMNPKLNEFLAAWDGDEMVGFVRLSVHNGDALAPLNDSVDRLRLSYLKRLPLSLLRRVRNMLSAMAQKLEKRSPIHSMVTPARRGYIADIYVRPESRRNKIGETLVNEALQWFDKMGVAYVDLNMLAGNEAARKFWRSMGFHDRSIMAFRKPAKPAR